MDEKPIRIRRSAHNAENHYFLCSRATAQDENLSYEAGGLLAYLLSKPIDWVVNAKDLQKKGAGRDKVYKILKELETNKYLWREWIKEKGVVLGIEYIVFEEPFTEKPDTASPDTANPDSIYNRIKQNKDSTDSLGKPSLPVSTRFTKSRYHAFNETSLTASSRTYTESEYPAATERLAPKGYTLIKGSILNARPDADRITIVQTPNDNSSKPLFDVFAKEAYGIKQGNPVPDGVASLIGKLIKEFAVLLNRTSNEITADVELALKVQKAYDKWKQVKPTLDKPKHSGSFTTWWNECCSQLDTSSSVLGGVNLS